MLAEADDARGRLQHELVKQVAHLERLLEVAALVHVDRLQVLAAREDDRVVLVLGLALAEHDVTLVRVRVRVRARIRVRVRVKG